MTDTFLAHTSDAPPRGPAKTDPRHSPSAASKGWTLALASARRVLDVIGRGRRCNSTTDAVYRFACKFVGSGVDDQRLQPGFRPA